MKTSSSKSGVPALLLALVIGAAAGLAIGRSIASPSSSGGRTYEDGVRDTKKKLEDLHLIAMEPATMTQLSGTVLEVGDAGFTMQIDAAVANPLDADMPMQRTVTLAPGATITQQVLRDKASYAKDQADYNAKLGVTVGGSPDAKDLPAAPSPYEEKTIALKDLPRNSRITVTADHDVKTAASFVATQVVIGYAAAAPFTPPPPPPDRPPAPSGSRPPPAKNDAPLPMPAPPTK